MNDTTPEDQLANELAEDQKWQERILAETSFDIEAFRKELAEIKKAITRPARRKTPANRQRPDYQVSEEIKTLRVEAARLKKLLTDRGISIPTDLGKVKPGEGTERVFTRPKRGNNSQIVILGPW